MSDKIEEIRRKLPDVGFYTEAGVDYQHLLAEVDRLRAEIDGLEAELSLMQSGFEIAYRALGAKP